MVYQWIIIIGIWKNTRRTEHRNCRMKGASQVSLWERSELRTEGDLRYFVNNLVEAPSRKSEFMVPCPLRLWDYVSKV